MPHIEISFKETDGTVNTNIFGQFIEHLGSCIDGGIYDPSSSFSDENGIRQDVIALVKRLQPPIIRFPGGTVMCIYHWEDHVGPAEKRRKRKNLIWGGVMDPSFGTAEFVNYCRSVGAEPMICVNMASGTAEEAANWVEYCNGTSDTYYANLRRQHGYNEPFHIKYWCIGNECYAEPDIGIQSDVNIYIRDAREFIKFMKLTDPTIKCVIVGSDDMDGWNKPVLDALSPFTDYFSYHFYASENARGLYSPFIDESAFLTKIDALKSLIASYPALPENFSPWYRFPPRQNEIKLLIDEWNIWEFKDDALYGLDMVYNWRDALWVASMVNNFVNEPLIDGANMAQLVNILAPIRTSCKGAYGQTIFTPMEVLRKSMTGRRLVPAISENPPVSVESSVLSLSVSGVMSENGKSISIVNRSFENDLSVVLPFDGVMEIYSANADSFNTFDEKCMLKSLRPAKANMPFTLPKGSFALFRENP